MLLLKSKITCGFSLDENVQNVKDVYNRTAHLYASVKTTDEKNFFYINSIDCFLRQVSCGKVLDLGSGTGYLANYFFEKGFSVVGCDISENMVELSTHNYPHIPFVHADMQSYVSKVKFDAAIASFSFIHLTLDQAIKTLKNLHNILLPNGKIFISVLMGNICNYVVETYDPSLKVFFKQYDPTELYLLLLKSGFKLDMIKFGLDKDPRALSTDIMCAFAQKIEV